MQHIKKIADEIIKMAAPIKHVLTLQLDPNSLRSLEKIFGDIKGFSDVSSDKVQLQVAITINSENTSVVDFETELNNALKRKSLTNVRFVVIRSVGRPTRVMKPR